MMGTIAIGGMDNDHFLLKDVNEKGARAYISVEHIDPVKPKESPDTFAIRWSFRIEQVKGIFEFAAEFRRTGDDIDCLEIFLGQYITPHGEYFNLLDYVDNNVLGNFLITDDGAFAHDYQEETVLVHEGEEVLPDMEYILAAADAFQEPRFGFIVGGPERAKIFKYLETDADDPIEPCRLRNFLNLTTKVNFHWGHENIPGDFVETVPFDKPEVKEYNLEYASPNSPEGSFRALAPGNYLVVGDHLVRVEKFPNPQGRSISSTNAPTLTAKILKKSQYLGDEDFA